MFGYYKLALKLAAAIAETGCLRTELARAHAQADWLAAHVNELKVERAELLARAYGLAIPVPTVEINRGNLAGADPNYGQQVDMGAAPKLPLGDLLNQARDLAEAKKRGAGNQSNTAGYVDFEDMGDEEARDHGIGHNTAGEVVYQGEER